MRAAEPIGLALTLSLLAFLVVDSTAIRVGLTRMVIDESERRIDHTAPSPPTLELTGVRRGQGPIQVDSLAVMGSDDDEGSISFKVVGSLDDRTKVDQMGYRFHFVDGETPRRLSIPEDAFVAGGGALHLYWIDGTTWDQEPFFFRVAVVALDRAGNESARSNVVLVGHDGDLSWQKRQAEVHEERMRRLAGVSHVPDTSYSSKAPSALLDVYEATTIDLLKSAGSGRIDRVASVYLAEGGTPHSVDPNMVTTETGRTLSREEVQQLQSILLNPKNYITDKYLCEFIPAYEFVLQTNSEDYSVRLSSSCFVASVERVPNSDYGNLTPAAASLLRSFCEGLFRLPLRADDP